MATLQAATTSIGATVSDPQAVRELCENHCFGTLDWEVTDEGKLTIGGFDNFEVYEVRENNLPDYEGEIETHEFLRKLADYLKPDEELVDSFTSGYLHWTRRDLTPDRPTARIASGSISSQPRWSRRSPDRDD